LVVFLSFSAPYVPSFTLVDKVETRGNFEEKFLEDYISDITSNAVKFGAHEVECDKNAVN